MHPLLPLLLSTTSLLSDFDSRPRTHEWLDEDYDLEAEREYLSRNSFSPLSIYDQFFSDMIQQFYKMYVDDASSIKIDKDKFQIELNVKEFKPEEIEVKIVDDRYVQINAKHAEKKGEKEFIARRFSQRYLLPERVDPATVKTTISSDGVLLIEAPLKPEIEPPTSEKKLEIEFTGEPALEPYDQKEVGTTVVPEDETPFEEEEEDLTKSAEPEEKSSPSKANREAMGSKNWTNWVTKVQ